MTKMITKNPRTTLQDIKQFERKYDIIFPQKYVEFLLESNFKITNDSGESLFNKFYVIVDMKSNMAKTFVVL